MKRSEIDIARPVVAWLTDAGWTVYQEVEHRAGRADIVATLGSLLWVIETKTVLSLDLLAQTARWAPYANLTSAAAPPAQRSYDARDMASRIAESFGFGLLMVGDRVHEEHRPRLNRKPAASLRDALRPEHLTYAEAGNAASRFWSPFKDTCRQVRSLVAVEPGIGYGDLLDRIKHHYSNKSSARATLWRRIEAGQVPGVQLRTTDGMSLWPVTNGSERVPPVERKEA